MTEPLEPRLLLSWIGAVSGNTNDAAHLYNNTANWVGGVIDNSFSGVTFTGNTTLYFNASLTTGAAGMNLGYSGGFNLTFESSSTTTQTLTLAGNITGAFGGASVTIGDPSNGLDLDLGAATRTFNLAAGDTLAILNTVSGGVGLTKSGNGTLTLDGANSYSGTTSSTAGQLNIGSATAVGTGAFNVSGGKIDNVSSTALTLTNNNVATLGSFTFVGTNDLNLGTGAVTITANRTFTVAAGNLTIGGAIGETGGSRKLTKAGAGTLTLSGPNTFSGGTTLSAGQLNIDNATAIGSGTFTISGGAIDNTSGSAVALSNNDLQSWSGNFTFVGSSSLDLGAGAVTLSANRIVTTDAETLTVDGVISGAHSLTASGAGALVLTGSNTYSGGTTVSGGTLAADNAAGSATGSAAVFVSSGATLAGTGSISAAVTINSGGTLSPGDGGTAILNTGALTLAAGSNLNILLSGNTAGTGYSQVNVNGAATITGSNLNLSGTRNGHDGTSLTVLASTSAVTGTFTGLAQGGTASNNGVNYTINYTGGAGNNIVLTANLAATSTALNSSANPSVFGQSTTFTATVTSGSAGTPSGSVTFFDGATSLGTATLNGSAVASLSLSTLNIASHSITAVYSGDSDFTNSTSSATNQTVNQDSSTITLVPSTNPSVFGQSVTLTATVSANSPGAGTPTGNVTFKDGATTLGSGTLNGSGQATFSTSLPIGGNSLTAVYAGDSNFTTSTSTATNQTVNQDSSTTTLVPSINPSVFGQNVTLTATVTANSPGAGTPTGTVTFEDGTTTLGTGTLNGSGQATFSTSALLIASNSLTAVYAGDTDFTTSASLAVSQTVNQDGTTTSLSPSANPSVFGQSVTFTASVTSNAPGTGTPTGTITFYDGLNNLGTATLNGSGVATISLSTLSVATHSITAVYGGDSDFITSTSSATNQTVNQDSSTTTLVPSANPSVFGQSVTLTATVSANAPGAGTPTGNVTFKDGTTTLGTGTLNGSGQATFSTSALLIGSNSLTAVYAGDTDFAASTSSTVIQIVNLDSTTTSLTPSVNPSVFGEPVTFTATVTSNTPGAGTPTGTLTFYDGLIDLGTATVNGSGVGTISLSTLSVATHPITAVYDGDTDFITSTSTATSEIVNQDSSMTTLVPSTNPSVFGQSVTLTATVIANSPGAGTPTGTVTFMDGSTTLGTGTLNGSAQAAFSTSALLVGTNSLIAVYAGDSDFTTSTSSATNENVNQDSTTTSLSPSVNPSVYGQSVTFTTTVTANTPGAGTPTGTVTFYDGPTTLGVVTLNGSAVATIAVSNLTVAAHSITAIYGGDNDFITSTSSAASQTVNQDGSTTTVVPSINPSVFGQSVIFAATVSANSPGAGTPTGTVTFYDASSSLGTATLNGSGTTTLSSSALSIGSNSISVVYSGDAEFAVGTSSTLTQIVNQDATASVVGSSANPIVFGEPITFTATVTSNSPGSGTPTGTVTFMDGSTTLGTSTLNVSGQATLSTSALSIGTGSISIIYAGDANFLASTSTAINQTVDPDSTSVALTSSANPELFGQIVTFTATVTANSPGSGTPTGSVTFDDGSTLLGTGTLDGAGEAMLAISTLSPGTHPITAVFSGDTNFTSNSSVAFLQTIDPLPPTKLAFSQQPLAVIAGDPIATTIVIEDALGDIVTMDNSSVTLSINTGPGSLSGTVSLNAQNGVTTFSNVSLTTPGFYTLLASDGLLSGAVSAGFDVTDAGSNLVFASQPTAVTAGDGATTMTAELVTPTGAIDSAFNGTVSLSIASGPAGGQILGSLDVVAQNGIAAWNNVRFTRAGAYTLQATTLRELTAQTAPIAVGPGPVAQTVVSTRPVMSWQFGVINPGPVIALADQFGNIVPNAPATVTASILSGPPGAVLTGITTVPVHNGYAAFENLSVNISGFYSLAFSDGIQTPAVISDVEIVAIPARRFTFNGAPLGEQSILLQQQRNAPSYIAQTPIARAAEFAVATASSRRLFAAALMHLAPSDIASPQFIAFPIYGEAPPNSILNSIPDADRKLLE